MFNLKKILSLFLFSFTSSAVFASEVITYEIKGMHCNSCAQVIEKKVCSHKSIESCKVTVGEITYQLRDGEKLSKEELSSLLKEAGKYEIIQ